MFTAITKYVLPRETKDFINGRLVFASREIFSRRIHAARAPTPWATAMLEEIARRWVLRKMSGSAFFSRR